MDRMQRVLATCLEVNAPLISSQNEDGTTTDHPSYLNLAELEGATDIFFATDFDALAEAFASVSGRKARHTKSSAFLAQWAAVENTRTADGYNPLLDDVSALRAKIIGAVLPCARTASNAHTPRAVYEHENIAERCMSKVAPVPPVGYDDSALHGPRYATLNTIYSPFYVYR